MVAVCENIITVATHALILGENLIPKKILAT